MSPDTTTLLDDLTPARTGDSGQLVAALHLHRRRRTKRRALGASALIIIGIAVGPCFQQEQKPAIAATAPPNSAMLTPKELLDSFGDRPVALVTWPDGRQQLLAIASRPVPQPRTK